MEFGRSAKYYKRDQMFSCAVNMQGIEGVPKLFAWRGFRTSAYLCPDSQYIQIDFASRVLRDETVGDFINYFLG